MKGESLQMGEKKLRCSSKCQTKRWEKVSERQKREEEGRESEGSYCPTGNKKTGS